MAKRKGMTIKANADTVIVDIRGADRCGLTELAALRGISLPQALRQIVHEKLVADGFINGKEE